MAERRWRGAGVRCSANRVAYGLIGLAQKEAWGSGVLTEGLWWTELRRRGVVGEVRRRVVAEFAEEGRDGAAPGSWAPWTGTGRSCVGGGRVSATGAKSAASNCARKRSPAVAGGSASSAGVAAASARVWAAAVDEGKAQGFRGV